LQFLVTATSTSSVLQLGFQDDPNYLALDDISLKMVASTAIKATAKRAEGFQLVWTASPGSVYQPQYKTNFSQPDWINLGGTITADGDTISLTDTNAFQLTPQRFYRLIELR
jgi:hypothetical protein